MPGAAVALCASSGNDFFVGTLPGGWVGVVVRRECLPVKRLGVSVGVGLLVIGTFGVTVNGQDLTTLLSYFLRDLQSGAWGTSIPPTSVTTPKVIGGTGTTSTLTLLPTSGAGTTGADIVLKVGNNGATEALRVLNSGFIGVGTNNPSALFEAANPADALAASIRRDTSNVSTDSLASALQIRNLNTTANNTIGYNFVTNDSNSALIVGAGIGALFSSRGAGSINGSLIFTTSNGASTGERFRITNGGTLQSATAKFLIQGTGAGATQFATTQTTAPTCSTNCGTSPSVTGTDTFMTVTMGASGSPASGWVVTFNGTWGAAPACVVMPALAGMVVGKTAIVVATTTTTITVTTNGTAPATSDKYHIHCGGTQ